MSLRTEREHRLFEVRGASPGGDPDPGLYVHVPFCSAICPYCDFAVSKGDPSQRQRFVESLVEEISSWQAPGARFDTVYFGGGTPSYLTPGQLGRVLTALRGSFDLAPDADLTLEVNPEDVSVESLGSWIDLGFARVSLGLQALNDRSLRFLGRRHRSTQGRRSAELAVASGFEVVSADLIYGLPHQDLEGWTAELAEVSDLGLRHLSCYELTIHEGTPFARLKERGQLGGFKAAVRADLFKRTHLFLKELGWLGYETSSFAREKQYRSKHNRKYWRHVPNLGLGPSAHSFDGRDRWWNVRSWKEYGARVAAGEIVEEGRETLGPEQLAMESVLLGLRTRRGVDTRELEQRFGLDLLSSRGEELEHLSRQQLIRVEDGFVRPTLSGLMIADDLARRLT